MRTVPPELTFGGWIKRLRAEHDLTQERLAARVGCAVQTIRTFESGTRRPSRAMAERLADALAVPADDRPRFLQQARASVGLSAHAPADAPRSSRARPPWAPTLELIGREAERAALLHLLRATGQRLLTIVGPGGIGKTSLALQVAADLASFEEPAFPDGVAVVQLAAAPSAAEVPRAIAEALDVPLHGPRPAAEQLVAALRDRAQLLVLDNLEHLLTAAEGDLVAALVHRLLAEAPGVRVLATSRERLRLRDERVVELGGLGLPPAEGGARVERSESVRLFVERAQRVAPDFVLNAAGRAAVAHICRQLEGMPLAIELAASWSRTLSPGEIAAEIDRSLDFLRLPERDAPERHRSMRAALDHSWRLLDDAERRTLARMAVFRGGCDPQAAEAVLAGDGAAPQGEPEGARRFAHLALLTALIDKSLVRREQHGGTTRYTLHELVRQYAAEQLAADAADRTSSEARHTAYFAALLQRLIAPETGSYTPEARSQLNREIDNLRVAWARAAAAADTPALAAMARGFWVLYDDHGWLLGGAELFGSAAEALRAAGDGATLRAHLLGSQAYFLGRAGRYAASRPLLEEGLALARAAGGSDGLGILNLSAGISELHLGRLAPALERFREAAGLARSSGDHFLQLWAEYWVGVIAALMGDYQAAESHAAAQAAAWRDLGYGRGEAVNLTLLGEVLRIGGRIEQATARLRESLRVAGAAHDSLVIGMCLCQLGALAWQQGELDEARYLLTESVEMLRELGDPWARGRSLAQLVRAELARGALRAARRACAELVECARITPALLTAEAAYDTALILDHEGDSEEALAVLLALGHGAGEHDTLQRAARLRSELARRLDSGRREAAARHAGDRALLPWLAEICARPPAPREEARPLPSAPAGGLHVAETGETLSPREVEVLRLLIAGAANSAIADTLVISRYTVKNHVASILQKLGVATRTQAALRGRALGLAPLTPR